MKRWMIAVLGVTLMLWGGCGKGSTNPDDGTEEPPKDVKAEVQQLINDGWAAFESGDFETAVTTFTDAIVKENGKYDTLRAEALSGRGWSRIYLSELQKARNDFDGGNRLKTTQQVKNDIKAGFGVVFNALNMYSSCASILEGLLNVAPDYQFQHRPAVTAFRLRLMAAQSYYALGNYIKVASHLDVLDPNNAPHDYNDPEALLRALEQLQGN